ncbi:hypothetical protein QUB52_25625 [Microcoleus sp. A6-C6]
MSNQNQKIARLLVTRLCLVMQIGRLCLFLYLCPATGNVPIDLSRIAAEFPQIKTLTDSEESLLAKHLKNSVSAYG